jgi:hypothetical protein
MQTKLLKLNGEKSSAYHAGLHVGIWQALGDGANNLQLIAQGIRFNGLPSDHPATIELHRVQAQLDAARVAFALKAGEHQIAGNAAFNELAQPKGFETPIVLGTLVLMGLGLALAVTRLW